MDLCELINRRASILVSDPWEFGTECGDGPFAGAVSRIDQSGLQILLDDPIAYQGTSYRAVVAKARQTGAALEDSLVHEVLVNMSLLPRLSREADCDRGSSSEGSVFVVGSLRLTAEQP